MASVPEDFVVARNTEPGSTLPYLLRIPLGDGIILKAKDTWPRTGKVYCHRVEEWPENAEIVERVAVRSCVRRGAAVDIRERYPFTFADRQATTRREPLR